MLEWNSISQKMLWLIVFLVFRWGIGGASTRKVTR
jgi:hypothetical protein